MTISAANLQASSGFQELPYGHLRGADERSGSCCHCNQLSVTWRLFLCFPEHLSSLSWFTDIRHCETVVKGGTGALLSPSPEPAGQEASVTECRSS